MSQKSLIDAPLTASVNCPLLASARPWALTVEPGLTLRGGFLDRARNPVLHFMPGTAFGCKLYWPFLRRLAVHYDLIWHDIHGHGDSDVGDRPFAGWRRTVEWAGMAIDALGLSGRRLLGMGHSYGGCMTIILAAQRPSLFESLVLVDPFMVPEKTERQYRQMVAALVEKTRQRNPRWPDADAVRRYLASRFMFQDWSEEGIEAFLAFNMDVAADGSGLILKCPPTIEAGVYDDVVDGLWPSVSRLSVPTVILSGDRTVPFFAAGHQEAAAMNARIRWRTVPGGHNYMQERPAPSAAAVLEAIADAPTADDR